MRSLALFCLTGFLLTVPAFAGSLFETASADKPVHTAPMMQPGAGGYPRGPQNQTALHWVAFHGDVAMTRKLITSGADINARVKKGSTPLHLAAYKGHTEVARLLIANGARVNVHTREGISPLDWARHNGNSEVAQLLITHGAQTGSSQAATAMTLRRSDRKLEDLQHFAALKPMLARQQSAPGPEHSTRRTERQTSAELTPTDQPQAGTVRIQLAALGSHERALAAWSLFRRQHPDFLGDSDLFVEPVDVGGKALYRVQAGPLAQRDAASVCHVLRRRNQPCLVID